MGCSPFRHLWITPLLGLAQIWTIKPPITSTPKAIVAGDGCIQGELIERWDISKKPTCNWEFLEFL